MLAVVDYGVGNLHSVLNALRHLHADVVLISRPEDVGRARRLILPGVGSFPDGMRGLIERSLSEALKDYVATGRPFLGICLGMQLLFDEGEEFGSHRGLGLVPGRVVALPRWPGLKVPHVGWSRVLPARDASWGGTPLEGTAPGTRMYFVHSFVAWPARNENTLAIAYYGEQALAVAVRHENIVGVQFHPEKSGPAGLAILERFLRC